MSAPLALPVEKLEACLRVELRRPALSIGEVRKLSGGAIQENWLIRCRDGGGNLVLRTDAPSAVGSSRSRLDEFRLLNLAWKAGVKVAQPLFAEGAGHVLERPFFIATFLPGHALAQRVVKEARVAGSGEALAKELAAELAKIHAVPPEAELGRLLGARPSDPCLDAVATCRTAMENVSRPSPIVEWGLRLLASVSPSPVAACFCHRDFRTGNYLVHDGSLSGILDWEFADWSDPDEDLGWFCAKRWRFGEPDRQAGGIAARETFVRAYEDAMLRQVDPARLAWWEAMAGLRWAVIAHQQSDRLLRGGERSLELALIGRRIHETERDILDDVVPMIDRAVSC